MIVETIVGLGPWAWIVGGLVLLALEIAAPGTFFLWFGVAAILVGIIDFAFRLGWQAETVIFVILALALLGFGRGYVARRMPASTPSGLNERAERLVGTETVLAEPIVNGVGRIRVEDSSWRVTGPDIPSGSRVRVVGVDGATLRVEPRPD